jgi:hypothetical protein
MQDLPQNQPEVVEGEIVFEDQKSNTLRNVLIAAGTLLILSCCCCVSAGIMFSMLGNM